MYKKSYPQGTSKKTNYSSEKRIIDRPRLDNFFSQYDMYDLDNSERPGGSIYSNLDKYDSVDEFLKKNRPKNKKEEPDELYMMPSGELKKEKSKISCRRIKLLKLAFDFPLDGQVSPILNENTDGIGSNIGMTPVGGLGDRFLETRDFEGKTPENLDYTRPEGYDEYVDDLEDNEFVDIVSKLINSPSESLIGIPDGLNDDQKDSTETVSQNYNNLINEFFPGHSVVI